MGEQVKQNVYLFFISPFNKIVNKNNRSNIEFNGPLLILISLFIAFIRVFLLSEALYPSATIFPLSWIV